jgi:uncharacterized protein YbjT (DUF2867 family)
VERERVLVLGATGYIGGLLVPKLLAEGHDVRCLVRDPARLKAPWPANAEIVQGDVLQPDTLSAAFADRDVLYYLVHSMSAESHGDFARRDRHAAANVALVAKETGVGRIIYLGGLGDAAAAPLSEHLESRQEVGRVLGETGVPVTEFRAAVIVGRGSVSFRMVAYLSERLPVMITPKWVSTRIQPIAEEDVLAYLVAALATPASAGRVVEIGGADVLTYGDMIRRYAGERGLRRYLITVPVLTPRLSSYWVDLVTPIPSAVARPLIDGLRTEVIVRDSVAAELFPAIHPLGYVEAVRRVLPGAKA